MSSEAGAVKRILCSLALGFHVQSFQAEAQVLVLRETSVLEGEIHHLSPIKLLLSQMQRILGA